MPSRRGRRIVAVNAPLLATVVDRRQAREPGTRHVVLQEIPALCREKPAVVVSSGIDEIAHHCSSAEPEYLGAGRTGKVDGGKGVLRGRGPRRGHGQPGQDDRCHRENDTTGGPAPCNSSFLIKTDWVFVVLLLRRG